MKTAAIRDTEMAVVRIPAEDWSKITEVAVRATAVRKQPTTESRIIVALLKQVMSGKSTNEIMQDYLNFLEKQEIQNDLDPSRYQTRQ